MSAVGESTQVRIGADVGGTFTDLVFMHPDGTIDKRKVPSTPPDFGRAILEGVLAYARECSLPAERISEVVHATTVATNAILERKGARTALITTDGFRDVLELRRIRIPLTYDINWRKPPPLVERCWRYTVAERIDATGAVHVPLDVRALDGIIDAIRSAQIDAVAVCLLHAYRNPAHETRIGALLRERLPGVHVSVSHEVLPEMLEFERTSTTVTNAYLAPLVGRYLVDLRRALSASGIGAPLLVMQSNGGLISSGYAAQRPVTIIESGPAAGVVAAARVARACGYRNVITLDMGGTTTKASIIEQGAILRANEYEVGSPVSVSSRLMRGSGYLLRIPVIDVSEVGAGGGSIASLDPGGALRVGPHSAGAVPGPACYGHGNTLPTVTDANLILGYLDPDSLAGGSLRIDRGLAIAAVRRTIAEPGAMTLRDAAHGVHVVANSNMVRAIKTVSVERGRDPADFVLMAFGGAGPIHAVEVARALRIGTVVVPPGPGVFSAYGLLGAQIELHACQTVITYRRENDPQSLQRAIDGMRAALTAQLRTEGFAEADVVTHAAIDICYRGQSSELTVPLRSTTGLCAADLARAYEDFELEYERTYGHRSHKKEFDVVNARVIATLARRRADDALRVRSVPAPPQTQPLREVYFGKARGALPTAVIARDDLGTAPRPGPLIVQEYDATVVIPPDCCARLDDGGNIVIDVPRG